MRRRLTRRALETFQTRMLAWFRANQRDLPWRRSRDPYRIWVAEVMLQQTRIAAVMPYYQRFLRQFSTVNSLAHAPESGVLKLWSGLGYYSRARNLHRAAKLIVTQHSGKFPRELSAALELPGIGTYTAAAVLSIAYDIPLAVLDGNVARVLARIKALRGDPRAPKNWRALASAAQNLLATQTPGDWNQSLMELGEVICTPQSPRCTECPVARHCRAYAQGLTDEIPAPRRKRAAVHMKIAAAILRDPRSRTLLDSRPRRARHGPFLPHVAIPRSRNQAPREGRAGSTSARNASHHKNLTGRIASCAPRRNLSQYHPAPISSNRSRTSEASSYPHPLA